ncbi:MAG: NAD-dependent epimerase/dehydratase family protein [Woeseiaceae bacterium]|nr:NAD-dependent epimerase/dehydratase family protein [Woeseiaceae bacterium]
MDKQRRRLLQAGLLGGAAAAGGIGGTAAYAEAATAGTMSRKPLRLLVLGGTGFIGPHMVREALRRGHTVELFNRGRTNDDIFPDLTTYLGDRNNDLDALRGGRWDVVIDNSGYVPRHVADSARLLSSLADHYIYVSSISAYADLGSPVDEDAPLATLADETVEEVTNETYGPLKALCEQRAAAEFGADRLAILRPTYICGPGDRTDRYTYWPVRAARGGEMLWPGTRADLLQIIDVRDLANFVVDVAEQRNTGAFNTVTPPGSFTMGDLLTDVSAVTTADMTPVWVEPEFLEAERALEGGGIPIWFPPQPDLAHAARVSGERAFAAGLVNRPTRETARDTLRWWRTLPAERTATLRAGLSAEEESALLAKWRAR